MAGVDAVNEERLNRVEQRQSEFDTMNRKTSEAIIEIATSQKHIYDTLAQISEAIQRFTQFEATVEEARRHEREERVRLERRLDKAMDAIDLARKDASTAVGDLHREMKTNTDRCFQYTRKVQGELNDLSKEVGISTAVSTIKTDGNSEIIKDSKRFWSGLFKSIVVALATAIIAVIFKAVFDS